MAYTPYYPGGWQSGSEGGTPITPPALNNMENGIVKANFVASGVKQFGTLAAGASDTSSISLGTTLSTTNYIVLLEPISSNVIAGVQQKTTTGFTLYIRNVSNANATGTISWAVLLL